MANPTEPADTLDPIFQFALRKKAQSPFPDNVPLKREPHYRVTADFLSRCASLKITRDGFVLYEYMLLRCAPHESKRSKCADLYGDFIQKGEFFESKLRVATALGKGHIKKKSKVNWFSKTVKQLENLGLVKQIHKGHRGYNATYIVYDVREL